jgi:hypothetical protein
LASANTKISLPRLRTFPRPLCIDSPTQKDIEQLETKIKSFDPDVSGLALTRARVGVSRDSAILAIVIVHPLALELWKYLESSLDKLQYLIESGAIKRSTSARLSLYQEAPRNGASIGNEIYEELSGSFGGYVKPVGVEGNVLGMTCAHVLTSDTTKSDQIRCV